MFGSSSVRVLNFSSLSKRELFVEISSSFCQLIESMRLEKFVTFSSHSMSFKALHEIGYWPVDMISDDSAIFWKAFIYYDGNYKVVPIYITVSMDIAIGPTIKTTFLNIYRQKRRWAWGVENLPIVIRAFLKSRTITLYKKISYTFKMLDAFISWATWSFILSFGLWLPAMFASREFSSSTVYYITPRINESVYSLGAIGILVCMIISLLLLPKTKIKYALFNRIIHAFEWFFIPLIVLVLSAIPALDAQTRLMFGKYMEFWVTQKYRKSE